MYLWAYATKAMVQPGNIHVKAGTCHKQAHLTHGSYDISQPISTPTP